MSKMPNWKHYHIERNGNTVNERMQRYRRAWELVSRLAKTAPADNWRVLECSLDHCQAPRGETTS